MVSTSPAKSSKRRFTTGCSKQLSINAANGSRIVPTRITITAAFTSFENPLLEVECLCLFLWTVLANRPVTTLCCCAEEPILSTKQHFTMCGRTGLHSTIWPPDSCIFTNSAVHYDWQISETSVSARKLLVAPSAPCSSFSSTSKLPSGPLWGRVMDNLSAIS